MKEIIILSWIHNTWKTTYLNKLKQQWYKIYEEIARKYLELLQTGNILDFEKLYTIEKAQQLLQVNYDTANKIAIDRCLFDGYLYTEYYYRKWMLKDWWMWEYWWLRNFLLENLEPHKLIKDWKIKWYIFTKPFKETKIEFLNDYDLFNKIIWELYEKRLLDKAIILDNVSDLETSA